MSNESKEEAQVIPEIGEASFAFLTSFSDVQFQSDELDFLSSEPGAAETNTEPLSPKTPTFSSDRLKDRVQTLKAGKKQRQSLSPKRMRKSMSISNHGDEAAKTPNKISHNRRGSLQGSSLHGSVHKSSSTQSLDTSNSKTPLHFRKSIASESAARRVRRQALRDSLEANSKAVSEMELPAPDLMRSPTEQTMYLKSPNIKKQKLRRIATADASLGSHSYHCSNHSTALSLDSVDEVFKKSKKKKKHRKSDCLPKTVPLNDDDDDDEFACDIVSKKSSKSSKSKKSKRTSSMDKKKKKKDGEKKEKKKRSSSIKRAPPSREPAESKEEPTAAPATTQPDTKQGNGTEEINPMEFSKFEFSEACFDVEVEKSKDMTLPDLNNSETDVTKATSATTQDTIRESSKQLGEEEVVELKTEESTAKNKVLEKRPRLSASKERKPKGNLRKMEEESEKLGEEDLKDEKTQPDAASEKKKKKRSASASRERRLLGRLQKQEEESAELDEEGSDTLKDGPSNEKSETGEKKKRRSVSASKERKLRGRLQRKLNNSGNGEQEEDVDVNQQQNEDKKKRQSASTSKERTLRDRFRRIGSQSTAGEGEVQPQEKRRSASASSLRDRFRKRQTSRESLASARSTQQEPPVPPTSPPQRASTYSYSFDSPRAQQVPDSPMSTGWAKKRRGRQSSTSRTGGRSVSPSSSRNTPRGGPRGFRSGTRRQSMTGGAPLTPPPQQVSRTGVVVSPGRLKSRPSVSSLFSDSPQNGSFRSQQDGSFRSSNTRSSKKSTSDAFDPFVEPKATKLNASLHDTPKARKSGVARRRAEQGTAPPSRAGRKPVHNNEGGIRAKSPGPDFKGRYQSPGPYRAPASPVTRRRGPVSVPMSAPAAVKRPVRMRRSQVGDIGSILREDSEGTLNPRRSRSLKRNTINHRGNGRRSAESVDRRNNVSDAMSQLIDGCTSHHRTMPL